MDYFPKVLIISSYDMNARDNQSSITIGSYFDSWPQDSISQVVCGVFNVKKRGKVNKNTFVLSVEEIFILNKFFCNQRTAKASGNELLPVITRQSSLAFRFKEHIRRFFTSTSELFPYIISNDLLQFVKEANPEFIYSTVDRPQVILLLDEIRRRISAKILPHFMDDFPTTIFKSPLTFIHRKYILFKLKNLVNSSKLCFCISNTMCEEYKKRYIKNDFYALMNCVEKYRGVGKITRIENEKLVFFYAGGLHLKRDNVLFMLCNYLSKTIKQDFIFNIYTHKKDWDNCKDVLSNYYFINYQGYKSSDEINKSMSRSDVLVFLESFDKSVKKYTRYSISTKIPEYLSTGVKILAIGPSDVGSIEYLKSNNSAFIIDDEFNIDMFQSVIKKITSEFGNEEITRNALNLFYTNHQKEDIVLFLRRILYNYK